MDNFVEIHLAEVVARGATYYEQSAALRRFTAISRYMHILPALVKRSSVAEECRKEGQGEEDHPRDSVFP